jgi:hypothetical protein
MRIQSSMCSVADILYLDSLARIIHVVTRNKYTSVGKLEGSALLHARKE